MTPTEQKKLLLYPELVRALEKAIENRKSIINDHIQHSKDYLGEEKQRRYFKTINNYNTIMPY